MYRPDDFMIEELKRSCLVIQDEDLVQWVNKLEDVSLFTVRFTNDDTKFAQVVIYEGKLGTKVLKMRPPKLYRYNGSWTTWP